MNISVRKATNSDNETVAKLAHLLLSELTPEDRIPPAIERIYAATKGLIAENTLVWAFLAIGDGDEAIGLVTLNECASIYAGGRFGEISELYVLPKCRSKGVGGRLLAAAKEFGNFRNWRRLEVGAPSVPRWERTVAFYVSNGFDEVGPRLKNLL